MTPLLAVILVALILPCLPTSQRVYDCDDFLIVYKLQSRPAQAKSDYG